jgi:hypothetical protein
LQQKQKSKIQKYKNKKNKKQFKKKTKNQKRRRASKYVFTCFSFASSPSTANDFVSKPTTTTIAFIATTSSSNVVVVVVVVVVWTSRALATCQRFRWASLDRAKVVNYGSVFELPPVYRGQPLSTGEIEAILSGGASVFDVKKVDANAKAKKTK